MSSKIVTTHTLYVRFCVGYPITYKYDKPLVQNYQFMENMHAESVFRRIRLIQNAYQYNADISTTVCAIYILCFLIKERNFAGTLNDFIRKLVFWVEFISHLRQQYSRLLMERSGNHGNVIVALVRLKDSTTKWVVKNCRWVSSVSELVYITQIDIKSYSQLPFIHSEHSIMGGVWWVVTQKYMRLSEILACSCTVIPYNLWITNICASD